MVHHYAGIRIGHDDRDYMQGGFRPHALAFRDHYPLMRVGATPFGSRLGGESFIENPEYLLTHYRVIQIPF